MKPCDHNDRHASRRAMLKTSVLTSLAAMVGLRYVPKTYAGGMEGGMGGGMGGMGGGMGGGRMGGNGNGGGLANGARAGARNGARGASSAPIPPAPNAKVGLTTGTSRADEAFRVMKFFEQDLIKAIGNKRIVVKPNLVMAGNQLCATHAETIEGILEYLKSIKKLENAVIAESTASGAVMQSYSAYGITAIAEKYGVKLLDIDQEAYDYVYIIDQTDLRPRAVRVSKMLLDGNDTFVISASRMKTHDRAVVTLSLKNIVLGAPIKGLPSAGGAANGGRGGFGGPNDKQLMHGGGSYGINFNLFTMSQRLKPHFGLIEGHTGMEGNGPGNGTLVDHKVCVGGMDWVAVDRVGVELMGIEANRVGYLTFATDAQVGQGDLSKIEVLGEKIENHKKTYKLAANIDQQFGWMNPPKWG